MAWYLYYLFINNVIWENILLRFYVLMEGIKGLFSAQILAKFEEVYDTKISEQFDLICGTSTGGIIALAASANISMSDVVNFTKKRAKKSSLKRGKKFGKVMA